MVVILGGYLDYFAATWEVNVDSLSTIARRSKINNILTV